MPLEKVDIGKQIEQMIAFIEHEAMERAREIDAKTEEEFNIEKSRLVSQQRAKIAEYYDKKEKQIELQRKIQQSNIVNANRLLVLQARDECVQRLKDEARKKLALSVDDRAKYIMVLFNLLTQGLFVLMEANIVVRCRQEDYGLVQRLIPSAVRWYQEELQQRDIQVTVDKENFLADDLAGGVEVYGLNGRIKVSNTIEARLEVIFEQMLPEIRQKLFTGDSSSMHQSLIVRSYIDITSAD